MSGTLLLTGATGFIGSHVARGFLRDGWKVAAVVRPDASPVLLADIRTDLTWHLYDGSYATILQAMETCRPQLVLHLASCFRVAHQPSDLDALVDANLRLGLHLAEAMHATGCRGLVNTGSSWQHHLDEPCRPVNLYAATKQAYEEILRYYTDASELRVVTLQLFDTYGANDPRRKLLPLLKQAMATGETLFMSPGEQRIDLVHVTDVVVAYQAAARLLIDPPQLASASPYAVSSGHPISLRELIATIESVTGRPVPVQWGARPYRSREVMLPWTKGSPPPGWHPRMPLRQGLAEFFGCTVDPNGSIGKQLP